MNIERGLGFFAVALILLAILYLNLPIKYRYKFSFMIAAVSSFVIGLIPTPTIYDFIAQMLISLLAIIGSWFMATIFKVEKLRKRMERRKIRKQNKKIKRLTKRRQKNIRKKQKISKRRLRHD
ncbi:MAG: hypothetical protein AAB657_00595 [Patescibacteria group bacterium]